MRRVVLLAVLVLVQAACGVDGAPQPPGTVASAANSK